MEPIVEAAETVRRRQNLTDAAFAARLGIDASTWSYMKSGRSKPGEKFYAGIAAEFPELNGDLLKYLASRKAALVEA